jgi:hypothetical protein
MIAADHGSQATCRHVITMERERTRLLAHQDELSKARLRAITGECQGRNFKSLIRITESGGD